MQTVRTGLVSPATGGNAGRILLLAGFLLGALLVAIAMVLPAIAARFTLPGRVVIEHQMDLAILGVALSMAIVLVYLVGTTGR